MLYGLPLVSLQPDQPGLAAGSAFAAIGKEIFVFNCAARIGFNRGDAEAHELAHQAGESAGREAVRERFSSGDSRSSDGGQTYGERAGETWDAENDWNPFNGI